MSLLGQWVSNAAANAQQQQQYQKAAVQGAGPPFKPPSFGENVPEDELVFIGICTRWPPSAALYQSSRGHNVDCCQRMLML